MSLETETPPTYRLALRSIRRRLDYLAEIRYLGLITSDERSEYKRLCDEERRLLLQAREEAAATTAGVNWK
jgi:hypothetical protein